jgi:plasmid stabilization system protein ParE
VIYAVRLSFQAQRDIDALLDYLKPLAGETAALAYLARLERFLRRFETFPKRGSVRDDTRDGLRVIGFERSLSIAFVVEHDTVHILRILSKGQQLHLDNE